LLKYLEFVLEMDMVEMDMVEIDQVFKL